MESPEHRAEMNLLIDTLKPNLARRGIKAFVEGNMFLYYKRGRPPKFCGPDFFVVLGRERTDQKSYVVWEEGDQYPNIIVELISESTEQEDRGSRYIRNRDLFKTGEYFLYDPLTLTFEGFGLKNGVYVPKPLLHGQMRCEQLDLNLGVRGGWLRWIDNDGNMLPSGQELAEQERERAEQARERADEARAQAKAERERADRAEAELERLRAELQRLHPRG